MVSQNIYNVLNIQPVTDASKIVEYFQRYLQFLGSEQWRQRFLKRNPHQKQWVFCTQKPYGFHCRQRNPCMIKKVATRTMRLVHQVQSFDSDRSSPSAYILACCNVMKIYLVKTIIYDTQSDAHCAITLGKTFTKNVRYVKTSWLCGKLYRPTKFYHDTRPHIKAGAVLYIT